MALQTGPQGPAAEALWMIGLVERDPVVPAAARREATEVRDLVGTDPELARSRLLDLAARVAPALPRRPPVADLARCTGIEGFYERYLDADVRAYFLSSEDYRKHIENSASPSASLESELADLSPLVPAVHSWMTTWAEIAGLTGAEIRRYLDIRPIPPIIVLVMRLADLLKARITVREPTAVDALPKHLTEWIPGGLRSGGIELIDGNVPRSAISSMEWRP